jgi:spore coat polysaccharide biosynthesis protein SpsF (cytidylyltransferase family)
MATAILQSRVGSTRLPGKALMPILGKPMTWYAIETLKRSPAVDRIVLAVPDKTEDDALVALAQECGIDWFKGSELNVLQRFHEASLQFPDRYYFRATGDNPIIDYQNPQRTLSHLIRQELDYVQERGLPVGAVVEVFSAEALERAYREGSSAEDLEHVTWYMKKSGRFRMQYIDAPARLCWPQLRLTVDYPEDFQRVSRIIRHLYRERIPEFSEVIAFAREEQRAGLHPEVGT